MLKYKTGFQSQSPKMSNEFKIKKCFLGRVKIQSAIRGLWSMGESQDVIIKPFIKSSKSFKTVPRGQCLVETVRQEAQDPKGMP